MTTTRRLILMRHATAAASGAASSGASGGGDRERPLTRTGTLEARRVGAALHGRGMQPDRVLCSVARRCRETWREVARAWPNEIAVDFEERLYGAPERVLLETIAEVDESAESLLVIAHNPGISRLARELSGEISGELSGGGTAEEEDTAAEDAASEALRRRFAPATTACFAVAGPWSSISRRIVRLIRFAGPPETP